MAHQAPLPPSLSPQDTIGYIGNFECKLHVEQQPVRARMCGFGDKDRRPITPPPCVQLIVTDRRTQQRVPLDSLDAAFFILSVDLWDERGQQEVNLVRHAQGTPSMTIGGATPCSYPPPEMTYHAPYMSPMYTPYGMVPPPGAMGHMPGPVGVIMPPQYPHGAMPPHMVPVPTNAAMYSRNLIGSLVVNAQRLKNHEDEEGLWFVLQDLSVRTEGTFRLKMSFMDLANPAPEGRSKQPELNKGKAAVLATCFSQSFQVYSAKKFPGVIESTALSIAFADQGIKIPIRKEQKNVQNVEEYEGDE